MSEDISEVGEVQTDLFCFLILAWIIVYGVIWKGLHNSGKVKDHPCTQNAYLDISYGLHPMLPTTLLNINIHEIEKVFGSIKQ